MDFLYTNLTREFLQRLGSRFLRRVDGELDKFAQALSDFFWELFENPKRDWRARFETFVAEEAVLGRQLSAESHAELVAYLELWEQSVFGDGASEAPAPEVVVEPVAEAILTEGPQLVYVPPLRRRPSPPLTERGRFAKRPPSQYTDKWLFWEKLHEANRCIAELEVLLAALGTRLNSTPVGEEIEVESDIDTIEGLIWRHNDALETARDVWLREDLGSEEYEH